MRLLLILVLVAIVALLCGEPFGASIVCLLALLVMFGDYLETLGPSSCNQSCDQGRGCTCREAGKVEP